MVVRGTKRHSGIQCEMCHPCGTDSSPAAGVCVSVCATFFVFPLASIKSGLCVLVSRLELIRGGLAERCRPYCCGFPLRPTSLSALSYKTTACKQTHTHTHRHTHTHSHSSALCVKLPHTSINTLQQIKSLCFHRRIHI